MKLLYKILMAPAVGIALLIAVGALMLLAMSDQRAALDNVVGERFEMFESSVNVRALAGRRAYPHLSPVYQHRGTGRGQGQGEDRRDPWPRSIPR
jgi:hypothetical protein